MDKIVNTLTAFTKVVFFLLLVVVHFTVSAQQTLPYKNRNLPTQVRVNDLISRMTPEEKFWQLFMIPGDLNDTSIGQYKNGIFGFQISNTSTNNSAAQQLIEVGLNEDKLQFVKKVNAIQHYFVEQTRLGIPIIVFDEALHGLVRKGATAFPQSIALAATFDTLLMSQVANAIATETKQRGIRQVLSPVINIATDVRWGRVEETYGEDPYLTSCMAVAYIKAFETNGVITTPKHFLANCGDGGRDSYPIHFSERLLREIHLPPFKSAIEAGATSIMTSYNSLDGSPATANTWLLQQWLKNENKFNGFVISDAGAVGGANVLHNTASNYPDATQRAMNNGLDVVFQTQFDHYKLFIPPFLNDSISRARIDDAVARVLTAKFKLGLFEQPYVDENNIAKVEDTNRILARQAAEKSFVLLKNNHQTLPFNKEKLNKLLVVGQDAVEARLGGYSGSGNHPISILNGLKNSLTNQVQVSYVKGVDRENQTWQPIPAKFLYTSSKLTKHGLNAYYYSHLNAFGNDYVSTKTEEQLNNSWTLFGPDAIGRNEFYSVLWEGVLQFDSTAVYEIALEGNDGYKMFINDSLVIDKWNKQSYHRTSCSYSFNKNVAYKIRVQFYETTGNACIKLLYKTQSDLTVKNEIKNAVLAAQQADAVVVVAGITEGEFRDRAFLTLLGYQEELIKALALTGKPIVVLLVAGSAVQISNWVDDVDAVAQIWYSGEAGGDAVANLLLGKINPAGRMPFSTPIHESQLPYVYNHKPTGRGDSYNNLTGLPLFPFGYGLSYTQFSYSNLKINQPSNLTQPVEIVCTITNTGKFDGDEVVQLYIRDELASIAQPVMELKGFKRIPLKSGESKQVQFMLQPEQLKMLNENLQWVNKQGAIKLMIGASSKDIRLQRSVIIH